MKKTLSLFLAMLLLATMLLQTFAAAKNACILVKGDANNYNKWSTILVETKKNWGSNTIKFEQTKGEMVYTGDPGGKDIYGAYTIKVTDKKTKKTTEHYWKYKKNYTLKLKDSRNYVIEIKPYQPSTVGDQKIGKYGSFGSWLNSLFGGLTKQKLYSKNNWYWDSAPTWKVTSTKAVDWCYKMN